jgi:hypothetical protein
MLDVSSVEESSYGRVDAIAGTGDGRRWGEERRRLLDTLNKLKIIIKIFLNNFANQRGKSSVDVDLRELPFLLGIDSQKAFQHYKMQKIV